MWIVSGTGHKICPERSRFICHREQTDPTGLEGGTVQPDARQPDTILLHYDALALKAGEPALFCPVAG